ncbi:hypothetical protein HDU88_008881 [Geranomyces variabilis]|nr:hypothetical protein HDU88_008881 [Geranomyces variabilis]
MSCILVAISSMRPRTAPPSTLFSVACAVRDLGFIGLYITVLKLWKSDSCNSGAVQWVFADMIASALRLVKQANNWGIEKAGKTEFTRSAAIIAKFSVLEHLLNCRDLCMDRLARIHVMDIRHLAHPPNLRMQTIIHPRPHRLRRTARRHNFLLRLHGDIRPNPHNQPLLPGQTRRHKRRYFKLAYGLSAING